MIEAGGNRGWPGGDGEDVLGGGVMVWCEGSLVCQLRECNAGSVLSGLANFPLWVSVGCRRIRRGGVHSGGVGEGSDGCSGWVSSGVLFVSGCIWASPLVRTSGGIQ